MTLNTSAIIAILKKEEAAAMLKAISNALSEPLLIAARTFFETSMVVFQRLGKSGLEELRVLGKEFGWAIEAFHLHLIEIALDGYRRFHRGKHGLNFGDRFSYALAKARNEPLLCKGEDFKHTDVSLVAY